MLPLGFENGPLIAVAVRCGSGQPEFGNQVVLGQWIPGQMGIEYPELPGWEFTVIEDSPGQSRVRAVGPRGVTGESSAVDVDSALS